MMQVGIVNDLRMAAEVLRRIVAETPGFKVAWVAESGERAMELHRAHPADIVLMDLIMPGVNGVLTTEALMRIRPCAVLVVTATVTGNREMVFAAMGKGALDAVDTPEGMTQESVANFRRKLLTVSRLVKSATQPEKEPTPSRQWAEPRSRKAAGGASCIPGRVRYDAPPVIGLGASTGGPQALAALLRELPQKIPAAIVIVQHLGKQFVPGLQRWLQGESKLPVRLAEDNDSLHGGMVWLAHSDDHLIVRNNRVGTVCLEYVTDPLDTPHRPCVDLFFESMARLDDVERCGVLLTGMGRDGAEGLLHMRQAGACTMAQDAESCVVYGMPKVALEIGAVNEPMGLKEIAARMVQFAETASSKIKVDR